MSKNLTKTAYYPRNTTLHEALATKVITRVVSDGISLRNAVREAIKVAELNKKDIFLLMSVLQDYGMVQNGDYKNYWSNGWGEGVGTEGLDTNMGTNYYASNNSKVVTSENKFFELFDQVEKLRAFATDEEIISVNPELEPVIATMNRTQKIVTALDEKEAQVDIPETFFQKAFNKAISIYKQRENAGAKKPFEEIFYEVAGKGFENVNWDALAPLVKKYIPDYAPLAHVEPITSSLKKAIWTGDAGDELSDQNTEEEIADLEESFGLSGVPYPKKKHHEASFDITAALGVKLSQEELSFLQKALAKTVEIYKNNQGQKPFEEIFYSVSNNKFPNVNWEKLAPMIQKYIPDYKPLAHVEPRVTASMQDEVIIAQAFPEAPEAAPAVPEVPGAGLDALPAEEAGAADLTVDEAPAEEIGGEVNVDVTPSPSELMQMAKEGPQWEIQNMLSINKAEEYYNQLKKELEAVVFNPNIKMDLNGIAQYDKVRNSIDGELNKIKEAIKGTEKIEKKQEKLEEEINSPEKEEISIEEVPAEPTQKAVAPQGIEEAEPTAEG